MKQHRLARLAEVVRETVSEAILFELKDPRIKFVTVTRAEVSADLQHAKVYISVLGSERDAKLTMHGLQSASGFIQKKLGDRMQTRYVPVVQFFIDEGVKNSLEIARLLAEEKAMAAAKAETQEDEVSEDSKINPSTEPKSID
ncbi:MAG: 30S ribosome-binding factor RbfA [Kiritimatiellae bacterium]|jgi:ribosome-binding factor A|nr:30S ribosome-binding factor RbfA [Kiritimatiellia bacterium]